MRSVLYGWTGLFIFGKHKIIPCFCVSSNDPSINIWFVTSSRSTLVVSHASWKKSCLIPSYPGAFSFFPCFTAICSAYILIGVSRASFAMWGISLYECRKIQRILSSSTFIVSYLFFVNFVNTCRIANGDVWRFPSLSYTRSIIRDSCRFRIFRTWYCDGVSSSYLSWSSVCRKSRCLG